MNHEIERILADSISLKQKVLRSQRLKDTISKVVDVCIIGLKSDKKILFCGNGGSAADAQHLASEFSGKFYIDREPLNVEALHVNTSFLTAVGNDYGFDKVFSRLVEAKGRKGDILFGLSTSGHSQNVVKAFEQARKQNMITISMTGATGGKLRRLSDFMINIPSKDTPRIQEVHVTVGHIICELVEKNIFFREKL